MDAEKIVDEHQPELVKEVGNKYQIFVQHGWDGGWTYTIKIFNNFKIWTAVTFDNKPYTFKQHAIHAAEQYVHGDRFKHQMKQIKKNIAVIEFGS